MLKFQPTRNELHLYDELASEARVSTFRFGPFTVNTDQFSIKQEGKPAELPAVPLEILILLLRKRGDLLARGEIAQAIWPEADPADLTHRINMAINRIRATLGDDPANPSYIQTVIGKGYRFVGQMEVDDSAPPPNEEAAPLPVRRLWSRRRLGLWLPVAGCLVLFAVAPLVWQWFRAPQPSGVRYPFTQITFNQSEDYVTAAAISPDGKLIAYADADGVRLKTSSQLDSQPVKTPPERVIDRLAWFSDQQHIALSGVSAVTDTPEIWILSTTGGAPVLLRQGARRATPAPFGTRIAFTNAINSAIWCMDDLSHAPRRIVQGAEGDTFPVIAWSSNGKTLLAARSRLGPQTESSSNPSGIALKISYFAVDTDTGKIMTTVENFSMSDAVAGPSGVLLFSREEPGGLGIWTVPINPDTGALLSAPVKRQTTSKDARSFSMSASGRVATIIRTVTPGIAVGSFHSDTAKITDVKPLSFSTNESYPHAWSADSSSLYFEESEGDHYRLFRQKVGMHDAVALTATPNDQAFPLVTPDNKFLLFIGRAKKPQPWELYRLPLSGGPAERVDTKGPMGEMRCPLHGEACLLRRVENRRRIVFYQLRPVSGLGPAVFSLPWQSDDLGAWNVSPDGTQLVLGSPHADRAQLTVVELSSGKKQTVPVNIATPIWNVEWVVHGPGWFLATRTITGSDLYYLGADGKTALLRQTSSGSWMVPAPDGEKVAFIDQRIDSNVWMLAERLGLSRSE